MTETPHPAPGTSGDNPREQFTPQPGYPQDAGSRSQGPARPGPAAPPPVTGGPPPPPPVFGATPASAQQPAQGYGQSQPGHGQPTAAPEPGYTPGYDPNTGQGYPPGATPPSGWASGPGTAPGTPQGGMPGRAPYGFPAPAPVGLTIGRALGYGWERLRANPIPWIAITLVGFVAYLAAMVVVRAAGIDSFIPIMLIFLIVAVVVWLLQAVMIRGALYETDGTPPDFQAFFGFVNAGNVLLCALAVFASCVLAMIVISTVFAALSAALATVLSVLAAIAIGFLCMFALHFVIDRDQNPIAAIRSSVRLVLSDLTKTLLLAFAVLFMTFAALVVCVIGMVIAGTAGLIICALSLLLVGPVSVMALTYSYRALTDGLTLG
ncbi:hypothetical protein [Nocardia miyunensis]|uniref:hypothetical protein n=1 Tax=Nocardia miyunensis TaxID=282684 RepID=UPI000A50925B|nr:hypothetical protein [Nocardia miyunensis]